VRKLAPEEAALWERVIATVRPIASRPAGLEKTSVAPAEVPGSTARRSEGLEPLVQPSRHGGPRHFGRGDGNAGTLDGTWDRQLTRGLVEPESTVDLHGHSLASAYDRLDRGLAQAIARGDRVLLLVTGKPPAPGSERPHARGAIRAVVGDWLAASPHASGVAAVRPAHRRHGGAGALYIVLRRSKTQRAPRKS